MKFSFRRGGRGPLTRELLVLFFILGGIIFAVACTKSASQSTIVVSDTLLTPQPPQAGPITVNFKLSDESKSLTGAHISLEGDMTHAGMAPVFGEAKEVSPGQYQGQLTFNMGGDWVVLLHITIPNGKLVEKQIAVNGVQSK
jgi:hypothetical protein